jgi:hypothetical protein
MWSAETGSAKAGLKSATAKAREKTIEAIRFLGILSLPILFPIKN